MIIRDDVRILLSIDADRRERICVEVAGGRTTSPDDTPDEARARAVLAKDVAAMKRTAHVTEIQIPSND